MGQDVNLPVKIGWEGGKAEVGLKELLELLNKTEKGTKQLGETSKQTGLMQEIMTGAMRRLGEMIANLPFMVIEKGIAIVKALFNEIVAIGEESIKAAVEVENSSDRFIFAFAGMEEQAAQWRDYLTDAYFMTAAEASNFLSAIQTMLITMGMNADAAGEMSFEMVKLAADLAELHGLDTAQVLQALEMALMGNTRSLRQMGIAIDDTAIKQELMNAGIETTTTMWEGPATDAAAQAAGALQKYNTIVAQYGEDSWQAAIAAEEYFKAEAALGGQYKVNEGELDPLTKATATYNILMQKTAGIHGEVTRSADEYDIALKNMTAAKTELYVLLGRHVIPILGKFFNAIADIYRQAFPAADVAGELFGEILGTVFDYVEEHVLPIIAGLVDWLTNSTWQEKFWVTWGFLEKAFQTIFAMAHKAVMGGLGLIWDAIVKVANGILTYLSTAFSTGLYNVFEWLRVTLVNIWGTMWNTILDGLKNAVKSMISTMGEYYLLLPQGARDAMEQFAFSHSKGFKKVQGNYLEHTSFAKALLGEHSDDYKKGYDDLFGFLENRGKQHYSEMETDQENNFNTMEGQAQKFVGYMGGTNTGGSGADAASAYAEGFEQMWEYDVEPIIEDSFANLETDSYDQGYDAGSSAAEGYGDGYDDTFGSWSDAHAAGTGQSGTIQSVDWQGETYYSWDGSKWFSGNYWDPSSYIAAPQAFYDWYYGGQALTGGMLDMLKGVIPSFAAGGWLGTQKSMLFRGHQDEVVVPSEASGYDYQGLVSDHGRVKAKRGVSDEVTAQVTVHYHGPVYDLYQTAQVIGTEIERQVKRKHLTRKQPCVRAR